MKIKYSYLLTFLATVSFSFSGCKGFLDEDVFSQLDPGALFTSANGVERVLFGAYRDVQFNDNFGGNVEFQEEWTCDQFWETGGAVNLQAVVMLGYTWDASYPTHMTDLWRNCYKSIRNSNLILENIDDAPLEDALKQRFTAEARFVRAIAYYKLYTWYGGVPLRKSTTDEQEMERCTADVLRDFIEEELLATVDILPNRGTANYEYGRATKGAALGFLTKLYLNTKQWQKCADTAKKLMDLNIYELWPDYNTLFTVESKLINKEFIWVFTCSPLDPGNQIMSGCFPPDFGSTIDGTINFLPNMTNWARMDRLWDSFYYSFPNGDERTKLIITEYINTKGEYVSLKDQDNNRMFKYVPDVNAIANAHGNDIPVIRYADILLARAEALNELSGPTDEAVSLIQQVRNRAGLTDNPLQAGSFTKESLRDHILDERGWEFYGENLRRQDLLRHGKFIEFAKARGISHADDHHKLFPIPQVEIDANPLCKQNEGY